MSHDNQEQSGALMVFQDRVARGRAILERMTFAADADVRASQKAERDQLDAAQLAEKAADAKRTMGRYVASLDTMSELFHRLEGSADDLSAAEKAMTETLVREHQRAMAEALREFCGNAVDADKVVSDDTAALREKIASEYGSRHARNDSRDENGQFATGFTPEQD